jgi:type I restriction enzyme, S subunit
MNVWPTKTLGEICRPRQWPTLSKAEMLPSGLPVYGANGVIGYTDKPTHLHETILIGCRGSCGTVHRLKPPAYANGNAMALDELRSDVIYLNFLEHFLRYRGFDDVTTGASQPQIVQRNLNVIDIPLPPLEEAKRIAAILDQADELRHKSQRAADDLEKLGQAIFYEMFGDPVTNSMRWPLKKIREVGKVVTGNTPPRAQSENYGGGIEWIKSDNINTPSYFLTKADETISDIGKSLARTAPSGSILVTCIAGSPSCIGNAAMADRTVAFNQQINAIIPMEADAHYLYAVIRIGKRLVREASTGGMKGMVSKSRFENIELPLPPEKKQREFGRRIVAIEHVKNANKLTLSNINGLFASLQHRAFQGEL